MQNCFKNTIQRPVEATADLNSKQIAGRISKALKTYHIIILQKKIVDMIEKYIEKDIHLQKKDRKLGIT